MAKLTTKQLLALPLLASGATGMATAKAVSVKESTVSFWLNHNPDFVSELERLREQATREAINQLQGTLSVAVGELQHLMTKSKGEAVRLKAALFVIEHYALSKTSPEQGFGSEFGNKVDLGLVLRGLGISHAH